MSLWRRLAAEAHRRSLWQVFVGYAVTAWIIFQVVATLYDALGLPSWVPPLTLVLLLIGLPIVLITAFVQQSGPRPADLFIGGSDPTLHPELQGLELTPAQQRLTWRRSLTGGVLAFGVLAVAAAGVTTMRVRGTLLAQGVLAENDRVVLADFDSPADSALGRVIVQALRIDLLQSDLIKIAEPTDVAATLRLMQRDPQLRTDEATAREVAQRAGYKAVLAGEVGSLGSGFTLNARLVTPEGTTLAAFRESARDSTELVDAVQRLSNKMREKVGESLKSIRASEPLEKVTTASVPALRKYTAAIANNNPAEAVPLLEEAIALDSGFAMAHRRLAAMLSNLAIRPSRQVQAVVKAYELRDRLPEIERYHADAYYLHVVRGDIQAVIEGYRRVLAIDSLDYPALNNIALRYAAQGDYQEAAKYLRRAHRHGLLNATGYTNLAVAVADPVESRLVLNEVVSKFPQARQGYRMRALLAATARDWAAADTAFKTYFTRFPPARSTPVLEDATVYARLRGRIDEAERQLRERAETLGRSLPAERLESDLNVAQQTLLLLRDTVRAIREVETALKTTPFASLDPYDRPYHLAAAILAEAGAHARAEALLREYEQVIPGGQRGYGDRTTSRVRATIALNENDAAAALRLINAARGNEACFSCIYPEIARIHERLGAADSALFYYEGYITRPGTRLGPQSYRLPDVLIRVAELYEGRDVRKAIEYYTSFIDLWRPADATLQPRVRAAERRRSELVRKSG